MRKIILPFFIVGIIIAAYVWYKGQPNDMEKGIIAENAKNHSEAIQHFANVILNSKEILKYPDIAISMATPESSWVASVDKIKEWYKGDASANPQFILALNAIVRCTTDIINNNIVTEQFYKKGSDDTATIWWRRQFVRNRETALQPYSKMVETLKQNGASFYLLRAMNGYIYHLTIIERFGKEVLALTLYPNTTKLITLDSDKNYIIICSSEVQFTDGLQSSSWNSPKEIISLSVPKEPKVARLTFKTKIRKK